jgi:hypothetical protein
MQHLIGAASRKELCDLCRSWIPRDRHLEMLSCQDHDDDESISQADEETQKKALQTCLCLYQRVRQKKVWCRRKDLLWQKGALFVPLPSLLSLCQPLGCAPLAIFLVRRAFAHSTDIALSHSLASPLCFHRPWVQLQGCAGGRRSGWNRQRKIGGGCVYCWPGDGEREANGEMMRGVVWEDRGTDGGVLLVEDGLGQVS